MFKFLKDKIKNSISKIAKRIDTEASTEEVAKESLKPDVLDAKPQSKVKEQVEVIEKEGSKEKTGFFAKIKNKFRKEEEILEEEKEIIEEEKELEKEAAEKEKVESEAEKEVEEGIKEEVEKELEEKRIEQEKKLEEIQKEIKEKPKEEVKKPEVKEEKPVIKKEKPQIKAEEPKEKSKKEIKEAVSLRSEPEKENKGLFAKLKEKVTTKKINDKQFDDIFYELELALLENNVALEVIDKIKQDLKENIVDKPLLRSQITNIILSTLKESIRGLFIENKFTLIDKIKESSKKPYVMCFVGINGSGKTTTLAKVAQMLKDNGFSVVLSAADTFRAAAIQQLQHHGDKLNVKVIKHDYGSDPAAVAFDTIKYADAKGIDVVLIDTAGRMHSNVNLRDEMKKIIRVANPDLKIFVGEAITGNDCVEQAREFNDAIEIDGIILSKADIDEKGGAAVSVSYITKKPIIYIGVGQEYKDLKEFDDNLVMDSLGLSA